VWGARGAGGVGEGGEVERGRSVGGGGAGVWRGGGWVAEWGNWWGAWLVTV